MKRNKTKKHHQRTSETIINGSRVFIENGEVKTILNEDIQRTGWMTIEEAEAITIERVKKVYELYNAL